jgi:4-hydroxy-tetrahydrodipicolinate synthase
MKQPIFTGAGVAIITPFTKEGKVNYPALKTILEYQIAHGTDAIVICGTTGESATLSHEEHTEAIHFTVETVAHRIPVIAGTGSNDTAYALHLSNEAEKIGVDGLLMVTPYYNKASQAGLIKHYTYLADRVSTPIIIYNVPSRTGVSFTAETYRHLSQNPQFNGVKEASGNFSLLAHTRFLCGDDFYIWSGNDDQVVPMMALGAKGVISVASNLIPEVMVKMTKLCLDNDFEAASKLQIKYMDLIDALFLEVNPIPIKAALNLVGMEMGGLRLPLCEMSEKNLETLRSSMARMGLL